MQRHVIQSLASYGTDIKIFRNEFNQGKSRRDWILDRNVRLKNTIRSHNYNKKLFDKNRENYDLSIGDMVYVGNGKVK